MATEIFSQGNEILVDDPDAASPADYAQADPAQELVAWVVDRVRSWEDHRNMGYQRKWAEYWRMWRGQWSPEDKNRQSERSRLVAPALMQAIDATVSEIEEGLFAKDVWFDVVDGYETKERNEALAIRDRLREDMETVNVRDAISEALLNSAIFGTGIVKLNTEIRTVSTPKRNAETQALEPSDKERVYVCVESIRPDEFIPDPAGRTISEMLGCAHKVTKPQHAVLEKIAAGVYRSEATAHVLPVQRMENHDIDADTDPQSQLTATDTDSVEIIEYHGKIPARLLLSLDSQKTAVDAILEQEDASEESYIEAIVTIANGSVLLRAMPNPFTMSDRSIIAFQHEKVPGRFWGRGVAEKGYNPQKALDAEIRGRIDALGFISAPMLGVDTGRIPRGFRMEVRPGKVWLTQGPPGEVLQPVEIGQLNPATFTQTQELERMVQMGTGAFDVATPLRAQSQSGSNAASSNSLLMGAFVKRAKRSIGSVDRNLIQPLITKVMWRYLQYDPARYSAPYKFCVKATLGIVAREVEAMQLTQLLGMLGEQFPQTRLMIVRGIIDNSSVANKYEIMQAIAADLAPPDQETQQRQKQLADMELMAAMGRAQQVLLENQKIMSEIRLNLAKASDFVKKGDNEDARTMQEWERIRQQEREIDTFAQQNNIAAKKLDLDYQKLDLQEEKLELDKKKLAQGKTS